MSDNEKPSLLDLQFVVESTAISKSNGICRRLGVSEAVLNQAEMTYPLAASSASLDRFMYALKDWHDGNGVLDGKPVPVTYNLLCTALEESRCREVSDDLRKRQCKFSLCVHILHLPYCTYERFVTICERYWRRQENSVSTKED